MQEINRTHGTSFSEYGELYDWSISHLPEFWEAMWIFADIRASMAFVQVINDVRKMPGAR